MKTSPFASTVAKPKTSTTPMTDYTRNVATAPHVQLKKDLLRFLNFYRKSNRLSNNFEVF